MLEVFCLRKEAALLSHWLLAVARLWYRGAFAGQRVDSDEDYIYQPFFIRGQLYARVGGAQGLRCLVFLFCQVIQNKTKIPPKIHHLFNIYKHPDIVA